MEDHEISWKIMEQSWKIMENHGEKTLGTTIKLMANRAESLSIVDDHGESWKIIEDRGDLWGTEL